MIDNPLWLPYRPECAPLTMNRGDESRLTRERIAADRATVRVAATDEHSFTQPFPVEQLGEWNAPSAPAWAHEPDGLRADAMRRACHFEVACASIFDSTGTCAAYSDANRAAIAGWRMAGHSLTA